LYVNKPAAVREPTDFAPARIRASQADGLSSMSESAVTPSILLTAFCKPLTPALEQRGTSVSLTEASSAEPKMFKVKRQDEGTKN